MLLSLLFLTITLFVFKNSLYFTITLLAISMLTLASLVLNTYLRTLTAFMLVIVYVGAIIVLIGYICAISPNLVLEPDFRLVSPFVAIFFTFALFEDFKAPTFNLSTFTLVDFFYSYQGLFVFLSLVFILFLTLLMVTSQYSVPQGPFRSLQS
jgi:hypothetical protein